MKLTKGFVVVFLLAISFFSQAQTGNYFLSHYTPSDESIDFLTFDMAQDDKGVIYFANKGGVLEFDGRNWSLISTSGPMYTVVIHGQEVFAGGFNGFGKLVWAPDGSRSYQSLSQEIPEATQIISSLSSKDKIYFINEQTLFVFSAVTGKTEAVIKADPKQSVFTGLFEIVGNVYVGTEKEGLVKLDQGKLVPSKFGLPDQLQLAFTSPLVGTNRVLLGSAIDRLFIFDADAGLTEIPVVDKSFLENNVIVGGAWVSDNLVAIATLRGGVLFIEPKSGATKEIINYYTGLPDNEVSAILCDRNKGVWVAHDYGFTRIAPYLPFRAYSHYPGLAGNLLCANSFGGHLFVGTTLGLYTLVPEELYEEETYYTTTQTKNEQQEKPAKTGGFFSFLKKDRKAQPKPSQTPNAKNLSTLSQKKTRKVLKSVQFVFKKVAGADGKVSQLIEVHGKLLAAGTSGVIEVDGVKSKPITNTPVHSIFLSTGLDQLLVSTLDEQIKTFTAGGKGEWKETHLLDTIQDYVNYIFEDKLFNIWMCGRTSVFKIETSDNEIIGTERIPFSNPSIDEAVGVAYGNDVFIAASGVFNRYDAVKNKLVQHDSLKGQKKYFASAGYLWFYDGHRWRTVDSRMEKALKMEWLGLFQNIRYLAVSDGGQALWVITASNELFNFSINKVRSEQTRYPLFLREVRGQQNKIAPARSVKVSQLESNVAFEFIEPDFLGLRAIEYHYKVNGLTKDWTPYSTANNIVNFPYLPTGSYKVEVQSKDLMGTESAVQMIDFEVEPPYWRQSWFYATEFAFFSFCVFLSLRLGSVNSKYRVISRLLSLLTVIMLIQFLQTVVASQISFKSGPVTDFFIQVFIALLVLPIEGYLRKFMFRTADKQTETVRLWDERKTV